MRIQVNIVIINDAPNLSEVTKSLVSTQHSIIPYIFDYRLKKEPIETDIPVLTYSFEEKENHKYHLLSLYEESTEKPDAFVKIVDNVYPRQNWLDLFGDEFNDDNMGSVYFDFDIGIDESFTFYQKSMPVVSNTLPLVVFSYKKFVENIGSDNVEGLILMQYASKHVPEVACKIEM